MRSLISLAFVLPVFAACSPYQPELPEVPFFCGASEPRCPDGYTCEEGSGGAFCLSPNATVPVDAPNFNCANDSQLEPNDTPQTAFPTPVAAQKMSLTFAGLSICQMNDKDTYGVTITTLGQNLEVLVEFEDGGAALSASILNKEGTPIMNASPVTGMARVIRAYVPNLNPGPFYAQVYGPPTGAMRQNNYKMTINVTGP